MCLELYTNLILSFLQKKHKNWRPVYRSSCSDRTYVFEVIYMFYQRPLSRVLRDAIHEMQVNCILFSKGQQ
jgi:hypothetical protein